MHILCIENTKGALINLKMSPEDAQIVAGIITKNTSGLQSMGIVDRGGQAVDGPWFHNYRIEMEA